MMRDGDVLDEALVSLDRSRGPLFQEKGTDPEHLKSDPLRVANVP